MDNKIIIPNSKVYLGDCMDFMSKVSDKHYELCIVDPPYGIGAANNNFTSGTRKRKSTFHRDSTNDWDTLIPNEDYFKELFRISKNQIIWGGNYMTNFLPPSKCWLFWDKGNNGASYADGELAWTSFNEVMRRYKQSWIGANAKEIDQKDRIHPTQKPIALYQWILKNYAKQGDKILDTHLGSGSSRIAAYDMGFDFTGFELDADYFAAQERRFAEHVIKNGNKLFKPTETITQQNLF